MAKKHLFISDVDGILTTPFYNWKETKESKNFYTNDSIAVRMLMKLKEEGFVHDLIFLTGDKIGFPIAKSRVQTYYGSPEIHNILNHNKYDWIQEYLNASDISDDVVLHYFGDDLPDIKTFKACAQRDFNIESYSYTPAYAPGIVREHARYVGGESTSVFTDLVMIADRLHMNNKIQNMLLS